MTVLSECLYVNELHTKEVRTFVSNIILYVYGMGVFQANL